MKKLSLIALINVLFISFIFSQSKSTKGKDFWFGFEDNRDASYMPTASLHAYVTADADANCTITYAGSSQNFTVVAGTTIDIKVPEASCLITTSEEVNNQSVHIVSDVPVSVFILNYNTNSSDAAIVFPTPSLGNEYYTFCITPPNPYTNKSESQFLIVGVEDNTLIDIIPSVDTWNGAPAKVPITITLNKGEAYQLKSQYDLTGSYIKIKEGTCKKFAVFSGNRWNRVPDGYCCNNHLLEQMTPVNTWGKKFISAPYLTRSADLFRVLASKDGTILKINGFIVASLTKGQYYETELSIASVIEADNPICVMQYSRSRDTDGVDSGDPFMILLSPIEQTINHIVFNSFTSSIIQDYYLNLITKTNSTGIIKLDGNNVGSSFQPVASAPEFSYAQLSVTQGNHILDSDSSLIAYVYAYGGVESYGYVAGTNIEVLEHRYKVAYDNDTVFSKDFNRNVCPGELLGFISSVDTNVIKYVWNFGDESPIAEGKNVTHVFNKPGKYVVGLTLKNECDSDYVSMEINIKGLGVKLSGKTGICKGEVVTLTLSGANDYKWSPATGLSTTIGPVVTASPPYDITYTISASNSNKCSGDTSFVFRVSDLKAQLINTKDILCFGETLNIQYLTTNGIEPYSYKWNPTNETTAGISINNTTDTKTIQKYSVEVKDAFNCLDSTHVYLTLLPDIKATHTSSDTLCPDVCNGFINLNVTDSDGKLDNNGTFCNYHWSNNAITKDLNNLCRGNYIVTITDVNHCTDTVKVNLPSHPVLILQINPVNPKICKGDSVLLSVSGSQNYEWSPKTGLSSTVGANVNAKPSITTTYIIKTIDNIGCPTDTSITLFVSDIKTEIRKYKDKICYGDTLAVKVLASNGVEPYDYRWYPLEQNLPYFILSNDQDLHKVENFSIVVKDNIGCKDSTSFSITFLQSIKLQVVSDSVCPNTCDGKITLKVTDSDGNIDTDGKSCKYVWNNTTKPMNRDTLCAGSYKVIITDKNKCNNASDSIRIPTIPVDTTHIVSPLTGYSPLKVDFAYTGTNDSIEWDLGDNSSSNDIIKNKTASHTYKYIPANSKNGVTTYTAKLLINNLKCYDSIIIIIDVKATGQIDTVSNVITSNPKNKFSVKGRGLKSFDVIIFNRWGVKVFEQNGYVPETSSDVDEEIYYIWDGKKKGTEVAAGTYFYILRATTFEDKTLPELKGNITIFR